MNKAITTHKDLGYRTMDKRKEMLELEMMNCRDNIKFYENQIETMEEKIEELEKLKQKSDFY